MYGNPIGYQHGAPPRAPPTGPHTTRVAGAPERPQRYYAGQQRTQAEGESRGRGTVSGRARNKLPRDVCARCLQRGHCRAECPAEEYRPSDDGRGGFQGTPPWMNNAYGGPSQAPPRNAHGGPDYGSPYGAPPGEAYCLARVYTHLRVVKEAATTFSLCLTMVVLKRI